jgi:preprotein translocase subunit SecA
MKRFGSDRISGLMDRLGLEDDQPIEHPLVSRSIEAAQQKVEGYNFDIRKHTVEFDDVMNKQRSIIYGDRREILEAEDVKPILMKVVSDHIKLLVEQHTDAPRPDEWDVDGLFAAIEAMLGSELGHEPEELDGLGRETLIETVNEWAEEAFAAKEEKYSPELMQLAARGTLLRTIDGLWMNHLTTIDDISAGIGLRAYGQRDPLTEYKTEAFRLFEALRMAIKADVSTLIFRVELVQQPFAMAEAPSHADDVIEPPAAIRNMRTNQPDASALAPRRSAASSNGANGRPITRAERNRQVEQEKRDRQRSLKRKRG